MKRWIDADAVEAAILGGAILGGGGGGSIDRGLDRARAAAAQARAPLWSVDEFPSDALTATVALVGAPSASAPWVGTAHLERALTLLQAGVPRPLAAINTNENGPETTLNGWTQSLSSGLPMLDFACNGRAHPTGLMGALGLHRQPEYRSRQAFAGGRAAHHVEGVVEGSLRGAASLVNRAAVEAGGIIAVARNPVEIGFATRQGAPGAISHAIAVGRAFLDAGLQGLTARFGLVIRAEGLVTDLRCDQVEGLDVGHVVIDNGPRIAFVNEYLVLTGCGDPVHFPSLIMLFGADGQPLPSAALRLGMAVQVTTIPAEHLLLARTMRMVELYDPLRALLGRPARQKTDWLESEDPLGIA